MAKGRILIWERHEGGCKELILALKNVGLEIFCTVSPDEVLGHLKNDTYSLLLVDLQLSKEEGFKTIRSIKERYPLLSIAVMGDSFSVDVVIDAVRAGVCDFFEKPFDFSIIKRITFLLEQAQTRYSKQSCVEQAYKMLDMVVKSANDNKSDLISTAPSSDAESSDTVRLGEIQINPKMRTLIWDEKEIFLTNTNLNYLLVLMRHAPRPISFTNLVYEAQGYVVPRSEAKSLAFWHIHKLKKELSEYMDADFVENIRGFGYRLRID